MRRAFLIVLLSAVAARSVSAAAVDGLSIHWSSAGKGPKAVIFVHGWTCDSSSWASQVATFENTYRVVTLDLPGHGQSGSPKEGNFSMDLFARSVEAVRAEADVDSIALVGHSLGASVIRQYAHMYPQHVAVLVSVDGLLDMRLAPASVVADGVPILTGAEGLRTRERWIRGMFAPRTPIVLQQQIMKMMLSATEATAAGTAAASFAWINARPDVTRIPVLAVYAGTRKLPDSNAMKLSMPNYEAVQLSDTGHFLMLEQPEDFNRIVMEFLRRVRF